MTKEPQIAQSLSRRERQIMDILYACKEATAHEVHERLPNPPGYGAVRKMLFKLEERSIIQHRRDGKQFIYAPVIPRGKASASALNHLVQTYFDGSKVSTINTLFNAADETISEEEIKQLQRIIDMARSKSSKE